VPRLKSKSKIILYTLGEPSGIGAEVIIKTLLSSPIFLKKTKHLIIGDKSIIKKVAEIYSLKFRINPIEQGNKLINGINLIDLNNAKRVKFGRPNINSAKASLEYLNLAIKLMKEKKADILITGPLSKYYIEKLGIKFKGHTEYLAKKFKVKKITMLFVSKKINLLLITRHIPIKEVSNQINKEKIIDSIKLAVSFMKEKLMIKNPKIAVCGLNPHAGEGGKVGREEIDIIIPAIKKLKNLNIKGPFSADGLLRNIKSLDYNLIVSMFHDQALPAFKSLFKNLVNCTLGLPFLRLSPDHGPAFDIAGKGLADNSSMKATIKLALRILNEC
jgi:4-hydroxythreonine-4-phosphate dehydrogenase